MRSSVVHAFKVLFYMYIAASLFSAAIEQNSSKSGSQSNGNNASNTVAEPSDHTVAASASDRKPEGARTIGSNTIAEVRVDAKGEKVLQNAGPPGASKRLRGPAGGNYATESRQHGLWQQIYDTLAASDPARLLQAFFIIFFTALLYTYRDEDVESFWDFFRPPEIVVEEMISCE